MVAEINMPSYEPLAQRLLDRAIELEKQKHSGGTSEAQYGEQSNQTDNRGGGTSAQANNYGVPAAFLWANTAIACLALAFAVVGLIVYGIFYRELEREVRLHTQATDDIRASLIARDINPNAHDVTDVGGSKP